MVLLIVCLMVTLSVQRLDTRAISNPHEGRILYFSQTNEGRSLTASPAGSDTNHSIPFSPASLSFVLPTIQSPSQVSGASIAGPVSFFVWLASNITSRVQLQATFQQAGYNTTLTGVGSGQVSLSSVAKEYQLNYTIQSATGGIQLYAGIPAYISLAIQSLTPRPSDVTLFWGSSARVSKVVITFTNYASVQSLKITDYRGAENQTFNVQAPPNQNIVFFTANIRDIFGTGSGGDISLVNLTISGPQGPVRDRTNVTMNFFCPQGLCPQPAQYEAFWVYPSGTPEATYSATIDIVDSQGNVIHDTSGVHSFGIGRLPPPFPLLAALISGGGLGVAGLATGAVYLRRRRAKEYLAPFSFFEQMTGGEVPGGSMVTVEGNTGAGKTTLCSEVMYEDLKRGKPCIYVAADDFPDRIRDQMRNLGIDVGGYEKSGLLSFVDCYSAEAGRIPTEKFSVSSVGDLTTLGVKISSALQDQKGTCLYLDSLSPFVPRAKPESIVSFVHAIGAKVRGLDGKAFFTMSTGSDETIQRQMEDMADCVIQMEAFEEKDIRRRRLRIRKFRNRRHQESWATFTIEDGKGIIFYTKQSRRSN